MKIVNCASCGAEIFWATTPRGERTPVDAHPTGMVTVLDPPPEPGADPVALSRRAYMTHWATCPYAKAHRRR